MNARESWMAVLFIAAATTAQAGPYVVGTRIEMPEDGWYQVQSASDYEEICAGVSVCDVLPGIYVVINHTTGTRWEHVIVGDVLPPDPATGIRVSGNAIYLPDDGWYQVQDRITYTSLCEGVAQCTVPDGEYIVINHTLGTRVEPVVVPVTAGAENGLSKLQYQRYSASAIELFWRRDQTLLPGTCATILRNGVFATCTDGTSFFEDGLDPTLAYRYELRVMGRQAGESLVVTPYGFSVGMPILSVANAREVAREVIAVINEDALEELFQHLESDLNIQGKTYFVSNTTDDIVYSRDIEFNPPYLFESGYDTGEYVSVRQGSVHTCAGAGTVTHIAWALGSDYIFEHCAAGQGRYTGTIGYRDLYRGSIVKHPFRDFRATFSDGRSTWLDGVYSSGNESFVIDDFTRAWTDATFRTVNADAWLQIDNYAMSRLYFSSEAMKQFSPDVVMPDGTVVQTEAFDRKVDIHGEFDVAAAWNSGMKLHVAADFQFDDHIYRPRSGDAVSIPGLDPEIPLAWQDASIRIDAPDGSWLILSGIEGSDNRFSIETSTGDLPGPFSWEGDYVIDCRASVGACW